MQPYFIPYAGYFRLLAAADVMVMFDCVQFPRRGWVHRNRLPAASGELDWFTLPIARAPQDVLISALRFPPDARERIDAAIPRFPLLRAARDARHPLLERVLTLGDGDVARYLCELVRDLAAMLDLRPQVIRSSSLGIDPELKGQERVIEIARRVGGRRYVNPPGGRELYDPQLFAAAGLELAFLTPYAGSMESILGRLLGEPAADIAAEVARETILVP